MATSFAMLRAWGFSGRPVGLAVVVQSVWNQFVILGFPILAAAALAAEGGRNRTLEIVALVGLVVFVVVVVGFAVGLSSPRLAKRIGNLAARLATRGKQLLHKAPVKWNGTSLVRFRAETIVLIRRRWLFLTAATLAGHLTVFLVLVASTPRSRRRARRGDDRRGIRRLDARADSRVDPDHAGRHRLRRVGMTGALVAFGASDADAVTATLIYRFLTIVPTLAVGLLAATTWKVGQRPATPTTA